MGSIFWLYALCVGSFGIYVPVWVYRRARADAGQDRSDALAWAVGSIVAPIACAVLYWLGLVARARLERANRSPGLSALVAPALHAAIALILYLSPLRTFLAAFWLLSPLPILVVHARLRAAERAEGPGAAPKPAISIRRRLAEFAIVFLGVPLVAFATYEIDHSAAQILWARSVDGPHSGASGRFDLDVPESDPGLLWHRLESGTLSGDESELELASADQRSWVIVYAHSMGMGIDDVVDSRRELITSEIEVTHVEERRFFLPESDLVPVSFAEYFVGGNAFNRAHYIVLTAFLENEVFEVVGYTDDPVARSERLRAIVTSFMPRDDESAPSEGL